MAPPWRDSYIMFLLKEYPQLQTIQDIAKKKRKDVYLVGGFLRDYFLGRPCLDLDFAVKEGAIAFARVFAKEIKGAFVLLDQERGCARVVKKKGNVIQTFDFADFRAPTLQKDLLHRDFTVNTLFLKVNSLAPETQVLDAVKDLRGGRRDLKAQKIKMASVKAFKEDPLRLLRAFSLRAILGFKIEQKTRTQIKKDKNLIRNVAYERIREELFKILESDAAAATLKAMDRIGLLENIIPQITVMYGVKQGTYHHLDVWPHSLETIVQLEKIFKEMEGHEDVNDYVCEPIGGKRPRYALIKLAGLLHDIGKPETRKREKGRISFHGHEHVGKAITRNVAKLLKLSTKERFALEDMVLYHLRPGYLSNFKSPSERSIFRYFRNTKDEGVSTLLLSLADQRSTRGPATTLQDLRHHEKICLGLVRRYFEKKKEKPFVRLINGNDLIKKLKLKPSPLFGKILLEIEEQQVLGKIKTKKQAMELAGKLARKN